mgnify:CR=1 FL=1
MSRKRKASSGDNDEASAAKAPRASMTLEELEASSPFESARVPLSTFGELAPQGGGGTGQNTKKGGCGCAIL